MRPIDADALHEALKTKQKWVVRCGDKHNEGYTYDQVHFAIDEAPTIDAVSVVQGEWIDAEIPLESGGSMPIQACNLCKTFYPLAYTGGGHRFCPNCGAKMKGADDE